LFCEPEPYFKLCGDGIRFAHVFPNLVLHTLTSTFLIPEYKVINMDEAHISQRAYASVRERGPPSAPPSRTFLTPTEINHCPRILSLDGGGVRALSSLLIVREIMEEIQRQTSAAETPLPCEYFDLIGGTSTGGLIAIMLGRLGMVRLRKRAAVNLDSQSGNALKNICTFPKTSSRLTKF